MMKQKYIKARKKLIDNLDIIISLEKHYMKMLCRLCLDAAPIIQKEFDYASEMKPFWENYAPRQRGYKPKGESIPWGEVGEKAIGAIVLQQIISNMPKVKFVGLPFGGDIRFATKDALIHFDLKLTGPNDNPNEIVASPNQVSGDGVLWGPKGVINSTIKVKGKRASMKFQPELPPFYINPNGKLLICITIFLKAVYKVSGLGVQPLDYMELVCTPNGLIAFDGPKYIQKSGLFTPGKDEKKFVHKRTRIKLEPLSKIDSWRCQKLVQDEGKWQIKKRN